MVNDPWLTIIGIGEDGLLGLSDASRYAIETAEAVFGGPRHLKLAEVQDVGTPWPLPFSVAPVLARRGKPTVVLASGDPFWYGVGSILTAQLKRSEWIAHSAPSCFALAASRLGWSMEQTRMHGLHAAPFERLLPDLTPQNRLICTLRDGAAVSRLAQWLEARGFGDCRIHALEALGGPKERIRDGIARTWALDDVSAPVVAAIEVTGISETPLAFSLEDAAFSHDGQITKRPVRALTLSALSPRANDHLWDIGGGSGSISIGFCLTQTSASASVFEQNAGRCANIQNNAREHGVQDRVELFHARFPEGAETAIVPTVVFVGGGGSKELYQTLLPKLQNGTRLVANAVTLESTALLTDLHARFGGTLSQFALSQTEALGRFRGWHASRPVVQWSVTL